MATVATMTIVVSLWIMISAVTATMTRLMPVVMMLVLVVVVVVTMVVVIQNRTQRNKRDRRSYDAVVVFRTGRRTDQCQRKQATNDHGSKLV